MTTDAYGISVPPRRERMRAFVESAKLVHPHFTLRLLAKTLAAPIGTVRAVLYDDLIVSTATIERWCLKLDAGIDRDAAAAAERYTKARRMVRQVRGAANAATAGFIGSGPNETDGQIV